MAPLASPKTKRKPFFLQHISSLPFLSLLFLSIRTPKQLLLLTLVMEDRESPLSGSPAYGSPPPPPPPSSIPAETLGTAAVVGGGEATYTGDGWSDPAAKKKRGRPRKYDANGNLRPGYKSAPSTAPPPTAGFSFSAPAPKRGRGKVAGYGGWQVSSCLGDFVASTAGGDFTPHVVTVHAGEDVVAKIITLSQSSPRGVCVLSANGAVSNVTIRQPGSSGGLLTYEGRFDILSLQGSFTVSENGGMKSRTGGLSVSLASCDGRVIGGGVAGLLMAASPIQMVLASFVQNGLNKAQKRKNYYEPRKTPTPASVDTVIPATPISEAAPNINMYPTPAAQVRVQSYGEPYNNETHNSQAHINVNNNYNNNNNNNIDMSDKQNPNTSSDSGEWNISDTNLPQRSYPDINVSLLVD